MNIVIERLENLGSGYQSCNTYQDFLKYPIVKRALRATDNGEVILEDSDKFDQAMRKIFSSEENVRKFYKSLRKKFLKVVDELNIEMTEDIFSGIVGDKGVKIPQVSQIVSLVLIVEELQEFYHPSKGKPGSFDYSKSTEEIAGTEERKYRLISILEKGFLIDDEGDTLENTKMMGENHVTMGFADENKEGRAGINRRGKGIKNNAGDYIELSGETAEMFGKTYFERQGVGKGYVSESGEKLFTSGRNLITKIFEPITLFGKEYQKVSLYGIRSLFAYVDFNLKPLTDEKGILITGEFQDEEIEFLGEIHRGVRMGKVLPEKLSDAVGGGKEKDFYLSESGKRARHSKTNEPISRAQEASINIGGEEIEVIVIASGGKLGFVDEQGLDMYYDSKKVLLYQSGTIFLEGANFKNMLVTTHIQLGKPLGKKMSFICGGIDTSKLDSSKITFE